MIEKLREIMGLLSGYKQQYDDARVALEAAQRLIEEAEGVTDQILSVLRHWHESDEQTE